MEKHLVVREHWIDYAKCLLIYMVVVAHYGCIPTVIDNLICAFHMPAFFFLSGYLHRHHPLKESCVKNFERLMVPAFLFSLLCWGFMVAVPLLKGTPLDMDDYFYKPLFGLIRYDRPMVTPPCGVIWFLQVLFISKLLLDVLIVHGDRRILYVCALCLVAVACWYWMRLDDKKYLFLIQRTCASFPFVAFGYLSHKNGWTKRWLSLGRWMMAIGLIYLVGVYLNGRVGIASWRFGHSVLLWFVTALAGSLLLFNMVNMCKTGGGKWLVIISNGTIVILCLHRLMIPYVSRLPVNAFVGSLLIILLCYPCILFLESNMPWMIGKKKNRNHE